MVVRATPSWYNETKNNYYKSNGAVCGLGFGLNLEFKFNEVLSLQTGVGGDFDGGKTKYTYTPNSFVGYTTAYLADQTPQPVEIKKKNYSNVTNAHSINYLTGRTIHTSYVTIPVVLKMMTKEISGFKYFVDFGANIGVLAGAKANDQVQQYITGQSVSVPEKKHKYEYL